MSFQSPENMETETRTGFVYHPDYLKHDPGDWHPERPERLTALVNAIKESGVWEKLTHLDFAYHAGGL